MHGVRLELFSEHEKFLASARAYLAPLLDSSDGASDIRVTLDWDTELSGEFRSDLTQLGRRLWVGPHSLHHTEIWQVPGLEMNIRWANGTLVLHTAYRWPTRRAKWLPIASVRQRAYVSLIYYLVYFPIAWWLERERSWTLLHASSIASNQSALVYSGLPGCGKSTTSLAALSIRDWRIVSDNLLFTDGRHVFACVEPIHVDSRARSLLGDLAERVIPTGRSFSHRRRDYELGPTARCSSAVSRALGFLHVGQVTDVRPVDRAEATLRLMANDYLAKEWMAYQESAAAMHQVWPSVGDQTQRAKNLTALAQSIPCYDVAVGRGKSVQQEVEHVIGVMSNEHA
jgi:hypothetical protein